MTQWCPGGHLQDAIELRVSVVSVRSSWVSRGSVRRVACRLLRQTVNHQSVDKKPRVAS